MGIVHKNYRGKFFLAGNFIALSRTNNTTAALLMYSEQAGFKPHIVLETTDYYTIIKLVKAGMGVALVPRFSWGLSKEDGVCFVEVCEPRCVNITTLTAMGLKTPVCREFFRYALETGVHFG